MFGWQMMLNTEIQRRWRSKSCPRRSRLILVGSPGYGANRRLDMIMWRSFHWRRFRRGQLVILLAALTVWGCQQALARPNIVLITVDTLRADHNSAYGYHRRTTPFLEALAEHGIRVDHAYAPMPTTLPAHTSLFTSQYPIAHGVVRNGMVVPQRVKLLSEVLQRDGYQTAAFFSSFPLNRVFGLNRGFDLYDDEFEGADSSVGARRRWEGHRVDGLFDRRANETNTRVIEWLEQIDTKSPFFLWVHYFDPHNPYDPPAPWGTNYLSETSDVRDVRRLHALYDGEVAFTDNQIRVLVEHLDASAPPDQTLLIVTGDHGEALNEHDYVGHGAVLHQGAVRIPLIFRWVGSLQEGQKLIGPVSLVDLMPTILGLVGLSSSEIPLQGRDLSAAVHGLEPLDESRPVYLQRRLYEAGRVRSVWRGPAVGRSLSVRGSKFGVLRMPWKYIVAEEEGTRQLYDVVTDPDEQVDSADEHVAVLTELETLIKDWVDAQTALGSLPVGEGTEEQLERLRSLGYVR